MPFNKLNKKPSNNFLIACSAAEETRHQNQLSQVWKVIMFSSGWSEQIVWLEKVAQNYKSYISSLVVITLGLSIPLSASQHLLICWDVGQTQQILLSPCCHIPLNKLRKKHTYNFLIACSAAEKTQHQNQLSQFLQVLVLSSGWSQQILLLIKVAQNYKSYISSFVVIVLGLSVPVSASQHLLSCWDIG